MLNLNEKLVREQVGGVVNVIAGQAISGPNLPVKIRTTGNVKTIYVKVKNGVLVETITLISDNNYNFSEQILNTELNWESI